MKTVRRNMDSATELFTQCSEIEARELFEDGYTISVMTISRNPTSSLIREIDYTKSEELFYDSSNIACNFDQVMDDFAALVLNDVDGHYTDIEKESTRKHKFSYWISRIKR